MPGIIEFPTIVQQAVNQFGSIFNNEPERRHFAEYLTGLLVAEKKNVSGINAEFAQTTDQSCLNRWITEVDWDEVELNRQRLAWLQQDPQTRYADSGVIPIDNTLVDHAGKLIEDVGYYWDHAEQRHKIAYDYLIVNYVCPSGKHYALDFRRFRKRADCEAELARVAAQPGGFAAATEKEQRLATFKSHTVLCCELVDWVVAEKIPGTFSFDSYFTNAPICNWIARHERGYVGDLKFNRKVWFRGIEMRADEMAAEIPFEARKKVTIGSRTQWYFTKKIWLPDYTHAVRVVILWNHWNGKEAAKILITNQTHWEVTRVLRGYGQRWTGTETLHRDGKQHLGLGDCQLRSGEGQTRHFYLVLLVHSLLVSQLRQGRARAWATETLTTIGEACRAVLRETLGKTVSWAIERATLDGWQPNTIKAHLNLV
ncbi:MAG TPA: IS701 family transposase [Blastocatellia bacterium]|nr:IS701 family transposase [Blastocatellia bacterium]HMX28645.1 IS701 family transposase [Blastocatellia bacterium]HMY75071.1 IS701 family transposase [Blastocatellia bacterium]HMZ22660.1 IS701 family transposase [Blastocatellia bacterium]HNG30051.1 IS701 family transposase [Blastocatellia bacterium]